MVHHTLVPLAVALSLCGACASSIAPVAGQAEDGGALAPVEDGGAEVVEDGGLADGGAEPDGGLAVDGGVVLADGGRDDRTWAAPVFNLRTPSERQDPDLGVNAYFSPMDDTRAVVLAELDRARTKAHFAMFSIGDSRVAQKLLAMRAAGIEVKILWDKTQAERGASDDLYRVLVDGGVDIVKVGIDGGSALAEMHDKFGILDDARVMTGSMNWSVSGFTQNQEHLLTIAGGPFPARFEQAFAAIRAGGAAGAVYDPDAGLNVQFGPQNHLDQALLRRLRAAQRSIHVAMFQLAQVDVVNELIAASARGVKVRMIVDDYATRDTTLDEAVACGVRVPAAGFGDGGVPCDGGAPSPVLRANTGSVTVKMHQKYAVFDEEWVLAGSYNWTNLATYYNHENLVEFRSPRLAQRFIGNFLEILKTFDSTYSLPTAPPARYGYTPRSVSVTFEVPEPRLREGDTLFLGGDVAELGALERGRALPMTRRADGLWEATVSLPAGRSVSYKFLIRDRTGDLHWEGGPMHFYLPVFEPAAQRWADVFRNPPEGP